MLPEFDQNGFLPSGVHSCTGDEFLARFLNNSDRSAYRQTILNVLDFAAHHGARSVLFGGSFVTSKATPKDIDCVIFFRSADQIPPRIESLDIAGNSVDIFFASTDQVQLTASFVKLLTTSRFIDKIGAVEVVVRTGAGLQWDVTWEPDEEIFEVVRRIYINRHFVDKARPNKTLVTIHGIRTHADWNAEIALNASANGWMVAPFEYGYVEATVFLRKEQRRAVVDKFRVFIDDLRMTYDAENVSVIAHSFGTYIAFNYLLGFGGVPPTSFDTLILAGAIVDHEIDLNLFEGRAANIVNEQAPNDEWVEWARRANLGQDELFGYAGTRGFSKPTARLTQTSSPIFTHNNVIRRDVVVQRWLPMCEANRGTARREATEMVLKDIKKQQRAPE